MREREQDRSVITSPIKQQILLCIAAGVVLGLTRSPRNYFRIVSRLPRELRRIRLSYLYQILREFEHQRLISWRESRDGTVTAVITERGKHKVLTFHADTMQIPKPLRWDKKWRLVLFDIPERKRLARDVLRDKLQELGFYQLQRSAFVLPYSCKDEIEFLVELFEVRSYVYYMELHSITNEAKLKLIFKL